MADQDNPKLPLVDQVSQQAQDLRLHRHIKGGCRFVGKQNLRFTGESDREGDALAQAAGELVRSRPQSRGGVRDTYRIKEFDGATLGRSCIDTEVIANVFGELNTDAEERMETRRGVLPDHGDLTAP
jgi:hypothetical protein